MLPTLFLNIRVKDYVPEGMINFADALANPIAHQSKVEKRAAQLKALEEEEVKVKEQEKPQVWGAKVNYPGWISYLELGWVTHPNLRLALSF